MATKSVRVPELIQRALASHECFKGVMAFSAEEAAFLSQIDIDDILIAYPTVQISDLEKIAELIQNGRNVSLVIDSVAQLEKISEFWRGKNKPLPVVIEVDASWKPLGLAHIGVMRSGVREVNGFRKVLDVVEREPEFRFHGVMVYEAQVAGLADRNPFKKIMNPIFQLVRSISMKILQKRRDSIFRYLKGKRSFL